jgi:hypothetical protein
MLASIFKVLGNENVNILSCPTMASGTTGTTHLVVDHVEKARKAVARFAGELTQEDINMPR